MPPNYYWHLRILRPSDSPVLCVAFITLGGVGAEFVLIMNIRIKSSLLHLHSLGFKGFSLSRCFFSVCFLLLRNVMKINVLLCYYLLLCSQRPFNKVLRWDLLIKYNLRFGSVGQFRVPEFLVILKLFLRVFDLD